MAAMETDTKSSPLVDYRRLKGLSQMDLASKFGLKGSGTISKWENGRIPAECVLKVSAVTGIAPHVLRPDIYPKPKRGRAA
jgi:DNA-binding XRE family transcriptional regulator